MIRTLLVTAFLASRLAAQDEATPISPEDPAVTYLTEAEMLLYQPEGDGLESLSFTMRRPEAAGGGTITVSWTKGQEPRIEAELGEQLEALAPEPMHALLAQQLVNEGRENLRYALNRQYTMLLDDWDATLAGLEDGMMRVAWTADPASDSAGGAQSYYFDGDQVLRRAHVDQVNGQPIGADIDFEWRPAAEGRDELVLAGQKTRIKVPGPAGEMELVVTTTYTYTTVDDIVILSGKKDSQLGQQIETRFEDLLVNGEPVGDA